jgi:hypothetical protein
MIVVQLQGTRTGSTYFYRCLDSHPEINAHPEIFRISPERKDFRFIAPNFGGDQVVTWKCMYNHVAHFNLYGALKGLKIMHIVRKPLYKKVLSDVVSIIMSQGTVGRINYDAYSFLGHVEKYTALVENYRELKNFTEYMEFASEDFITEDSTMPPQVCECVSCFLGVNNHPMKSDSKKLTPDRDHWDYFTNANQIKELLARNGYL